MRNNYFGFILKLFGYTLLLYLGYYFVKSSIPERFYFANTPYLFAFFFIVTVAFHFGLLYSSSKNNRTFVSYYMVATAMKLFLFLAIIIIYALFNREKAVAFICNFFALYLFFTVFEVLLVYRLFGKSNDSTEETEGDDNAELL